VLSSRRSINSGIGVGLSSGNEWVVGIGSMEVDVVVYDGLEWVIGWRQLGVRLVRVWCRSELARTQLAELKNDFGVYMDNVFEMFHDPLLIVKDSMSSSGNQVGRIMAGIIENELDAIDFDSIVSTMGITAVALSTAGSRASPTFGVAMSSKWHFEHVRHAKLGGLTTARCWMGASDTKVNVRSVLSVVSGARSVWKFLEPSSPLLKWEGCGASSREHVWAPKRSGLAAPWQI
jgi:hypothetical protein